MSKRARPDTARSVASVFHRLPRAAQSAAVCVAREALIQAALALDPRSHLARRAVAALAGATGAATLAARLPEFLTDADAGVVDEAERALINLASGDADPESERILLDAVGAYDRHRRKSILLAGLNLLGTPAALSRATASRADWLADPTHPAQLAIRSLVRRQEDPAIATAAVVWLRLSAQSSACRDRLLAAASPAEQDAVLRLAHLVTHPRRARALASPHDHSAWGVQLSSFAHLSDEARRMAPRWICALPLGAAVTAAQLATLAGDMSPLVRLAVVAHSGAASESELIDLAYDDNPDVARAAAVRLSRRAAAVASTRHPSRDLLATLRRLKRSPHTGVRALCHARVSDDPAEDFGAAARNSWRLSLRRDRAGALAEFRDHLLMGGARDRLPWIGLARRLELIPALERDLCDLADDFLPRDAESGEHEDRVLGATIVSALGDGPGPRSREVLTRALGSADSRVAANAVEALARQSFRAGSGAEPDDLVARFVELKHTDAHRLRATSALAILYVGDAVAPAREATTVLLNMLADDRPTHRLAGVWLAERAAAAGSVDPSHLLKPVTALGTDADEAVRARAARCGRRLVILADAPAREFPT